MMRVATVVGAILLAWGIDAASCEGQLLRRGGGPCSSVGSRLFGGHGLAHLGCRPGRIQRGCSAECYPASACACHHEVMLGVYCPTAFLYQLGNSYWYEHTLCGTNQRSYDAYDHEVDTGCYWNNGWRCDCECRPSDLNPNAVDVTDAAIKGAAFRIDFGQANPPGDTTNQHALKVDFVGGGTTFEYFRLIRVIVSEGGIPVWTGVPTDDEDLKDIAYDFDELLTATPDAMCVAVGVVFTDGSGNQLTAMVFR